MGSLLRRNVESIRPAPESAFGRWRRRWHIAGTDYRRVGYEADMAQADVRRSRILWQYGHGAQWQRLVDSLDERRHAMVDDLDHDPHAEEYLRAVCETVDQENRRDRYQDDTEREPEDPRIAQLRRDRNLPDSIPISMTASGRFSYSPRLGVHIDGRVERDLPPTHVFEKRVWDKIRERGRDRELTEGERKYPEGRYGRYRPGGGPPKGRRR